jgi:hypothetical protein
MAYCTFRLYYKIEILEKTSKGTNWETVQSVDLGRAFLPDFMDWYNDSFLQRCFCTYREDEVPKNVKVRQHFPSFDKELGLVFVLEYEADIGGIEHKHYEELKKLIAKVAQDTDDNMCTYSDCVCHSSIKCDNGKSYLPRIEENYCRVVIDVDPNHLHVKYDDVDDIENLCAIVFKTECLHDTATAKESLADKEKMLELDKELIEKLKEQGKTAEAKKLATLDKIFKNEVEDIKFVLENKHLYFLK